MAELRKCKKCKEIVLFPIDEFDFGIEIHKCKLRW